MVTTRPPKTIVKPTALGPVANTDTKLLIYGLFQKGRVLAQDALSDGADSMVIGPKEQMGRRRERFVLHEQISTVGRLLMTANWTQLGCAS